MAPSEGEGKCIGTYENGLDNVFTLKTSDITSAGGGDIENGIYKGTGQSMPWIDTGFETTGDQLIVYANGDYFPWGKAATEKTTTYHPITTKLGDTDQWVTALQLGEDYQECELNTDIKYTQYDAKSVKELYENHLNKYTVVNPNNRDQGFAHRMAYDASGIALPNVIQADCINHNNCEIDDSKDENPIGCVLRRGAGIYMKFGEQMPFSYHIINHDVPSLRKECDSTGSNCEYQYVKIGTNAIKTTRIPFTLPMMFYRRDELNEDIRDTQEEVNGKLVPYNQYDKETDYRFTILESVSGACPSPSVAPEYQIIDSQCYKSVTKKLSKDEVQNYDCKKRDISDELHPDELCPPPKGQRVYVKFADTFYEDDEGAVDLIFASGAKNLQPKFKYEINGFKLSWIQYIPYKLIAPFWGDQTKEDKPSELLEYKTYTDRIEIYNKNGDAIYPSTYRGTDFIKTTRFGERGIRLCGRPIVDDKCSLPSQNLLVATTYKNTDGDISKIEFRPKNSTISLSSIQNDDVQPAIENWLIKIDRLNEGLFFKVRDAIIVNPIFTFAKIFFALWFVFSFGIGFLNKTKVLSVPTYTVEWKKFLILMWATDPDNYALIDDLLWPALFRYAERFAAGILEIGSSIYGASLHYNNPYEFFDESIQMMTSKQLIYKISSLANDIVYWPVYLGWFPLLGTGIIRYVKTVVSWIWSLVLVLMDLGQIIMLLPFYALISFFKSHEGTLKNTLIKMLHTFTHLAFEMGFFCLLMGFVYKAFLEAIDVDICWRVKFEFKLFWIFPVIKLYAWVIDGINSVFAAYKEIFGGLLLGVLKFFLLSFITDWSSKIAKIAADTLMPDSMARSIAAAEEKVGKPLGALANSALGAIGGALDTNKIGGSGDKMKDIGRLGEKPTKEAPEGAQENNAIPRESGIPQNNDILPQNNEIPKNNAILRESGIPQNNKMPKNMPGQPQIGRSPGENMQQPGERKNKQSSGKSMRQSRKDTANVMKNMDTMDGDTPDKIGVNNESASNATKSMNEDTGSTAGKFGSTEKTAKSLKRENIKKENVFKQHDEYKKNAANKKVKEEFKNKSNAKSQFKNLSKDDLKSNQQQTAGNNTTKITNTKNMQINERIRKMQVVNKIKEKEKQINIIQEDGETRTIEKNVYIQENNVGKSGNAINANNTRPQGNVIVNGKSVPIGTKVQVGDTIIDTGAVMQQAQQVNRAVEQAIAQHGVGRFNKTKLEQAIQQNLSAQKQQNVNQGRQQYIDHQTNVNNEGMNKLQSNFEAYKSGKISEKQFSDSIDKIHDEILLEKRTPIENMPSGTTKANELKQLSHGEGIRDIEKGLAEGSISLDKANNELSKMIEKEKIDNIKEQIGTIQEDDLKNKLIQDTQHMEEKMDLSDKLSKGEINNEQYDNEISKINTKEHAQFKEFVNNLPEGQNKEAFNQVIENHEQHNGIKQDLKDEKITFEEADDRMKQIEEKINSSISDWQSNDQSQPSETSPQQISESNSNADINPNISATINGQKYDVPVDNNYGENGNYNFSPNITVENNEVKVDGQVIQPVENIQEPQPNVAKTKNYVEVSNEVHEVAIPSEQLKTHVTQPEAQATIKMDDNVVIPHEQEQPKTEQIQTPNFVEQQQEVQQSSTADTIQKSQNIAEQPQQSHETNNVEIDPNVSITLNGETYKVDNYNAVEPDGSINISPNISVENGIVTVDGQQMQPASQTLETPNFVEHFQTVETPQQSNVEIQQSQPEQPINVETNTTNYVEVPQQIQEQVNITEPLPQPEIPATTENIQTANPIETVQESSTTNDVSYTYNGSNDEITTNYVAPEPQPVSDVVSDANTSMDVSYSNNSASETPTVEKHENHVENNDFKTKQENQMTADDLIKQYEEDRKRKNEGTIKADRGAEALQRIDAWTTKKK